MGIRLSLYALRPFRDRRNNNNIERYGSGPPPSPAQEIVFYARLKWQKSVNDVHVIRGIPLEHTVKRVVPDN